MVDITFMKRIDESIKVIMKDGKIDQNDIPEVILLIVELINARKLTGDEMQASIEELFTFIMEHYNLFPEDPAQKESFEKLFRMCAKLAMIQPNIKKMCSYCVK
jgi:hypothetical protein